MTRSERARWNDLNHRARRRTLTKAEERELHDIEYRAESERERDQEAERAWLGASC